MALSFDSHRNVVLTRHDCGHDPGGSVETKEIVAALGALGQDTRLELFRLLVQRGPDGLPAGVIAERLGVPPSSLTFHLQQLTHAGLITQRRLSRQLFYAANFQIMNDIIGYLTENCCGGNAALCAPVCKPAKTETPSRKKRSAA